MVQILLSFFIIAVGWSTSLAEDALTNAPSDTSSVRETRGIRKKLCLKYGLCGANGGNYGGSQGYGGYQGGYGGNPNGYGTPPINIAISQSQSSANEGGGGYGSGYYPYNQQYNGVHPYQGYNGYNRYPNQGYGGYRPGFDNGNLANNNQFNGNYYSGGYNPGYGHQGSFGYQDNEDRYGYDYDDYENSASGSVANARSSAITKNKS